MDEKEQKHKEVAEKAAEAERKILDESQSFNC